MKIDSVEAVPLEMPLKKVFSGSLYRVSSRNTIVTRIRTADGPSSAVYNGEKRTHGREIARIIAIRGCLSVRPGRPAPRS
jgi:D-galactarolactone cycloisomerase